MQSPPNLPTVIRCLYSMQQSGGFPFFCWTFICMFVFKLFVQLSLLLSFLSLHLTVPLQIWAADGKIHLINPLYCSQRALLIPGLLPLPSPGQAPSFHQALPCATHVLLRPQQRCPLSTSAGLRPSPRARGQHPNKPTAPAPLFLLPMS